MGNRFGTINKTAASSSGTVRLAGALPVRGTVFERAGNC